MRTHFTFKPFITALLIAVGLLSATAPAFALSVPGYAGRVAAGGDQNCALESNGAVYSNCIGETYWEIPLAINPASGLHTVVVSTNNPGGGFFCCTLYAATFKGQLITGDEWCPDVNDSVFHLSVNVPANGSMYLYCGLNLGGKVYNVNYSQ